jgi:4-amino-4-deoxy-L-arabinose transferase-like glycosyltransferase
VKPRHLVWLLLALDAGIVAWLLLDHSAARRDDSAAHLRNALLAYQALTPPRAASLPVLLRCYRTYPYPPLCYLLAVPFMWVFGVNAQACALSNLVFYDLGLWAVWRLGTRLWDERVGLLAAFLTGAGTLLVSQAQEFYVDAAVFGLAALLVLAVVEADGGRDGRWTMVTGLAVGLGLLAKYSFVLLAAGPLALLIAGAAGADFTARRHVIRAALLAAVLTVPWYAINAPLMAQFAKANLQSGPSELNVPPWHVASLLFYARDVYQHQFFVPLSLVCLLGLLTQARPRGDARRRVLGVYLLVGYALFTLVRVKSTRYTPPLTFPLALYGAAWLASRPRPKPWLAAAAALTAINFVAAVSGPARDHAWELDLWPGGPPLLRTNLFNPAPWEPAMERVAARTVDLARTWPGVSRVVITRPLGKWGWLPLSLAYYLDRAEVLAGNHAWPPPHWVEPVFDARWESRPPLSLADDAANRFILVQDCPPIAEFINGLRARPDWAEDGAQDLPDGSRMLLFARRRPGF